jgi:1-acyl-sn-glycerol-3-phosphate acyltransferase
MDAAALAHYGLFRRMGAFPVEQGSRRGAAQFLRNSLQVLADPRRVLWITPQGAFTDQRKRPVVFQPGLAALVRRIPRATVVPIAIEYTFWDERLPEVLVNVGEPITCRAEEGAAIAAQLERSLEQTLDELAALGMARDPKGFRTLLAGASGTGGIYELWQRLRAAVTGREYSGEHGSIRR